MNSESPLAPCTVCGGTDFRTGPCDRLSNTGRLPCCRACGSLERHRIIRRVAALFPPDLVTGARALQFSTDDCLDRTPFAEYTVSIYGGQNSLDIQAIDLPDGRYDWVVSNHVVNFIPDDLSALREMLRVAGDSGIVLLTVGGTTHQFATRTFDKPTGPHAAYRIYGTNFAERIHEALPGVPVLEVAATDPCTATLDCVYLYSRSAQKLTRIAAAVAPQNIYARLTCEGGLPAAEAGDEEDGPKQGTWQTLEKEIAAWKAAGRVPRMWLRDDDATEVLPQLNELWHVCAEYDIPLLIAAIPSLMGPDLAQWGKNKHLASFALHGFDHENRVEEGGEDGKSEFPASMNPEFSLRRIGVGLAMLRQAFGERFAPVLVPPWANCDVQVRQCLADIGLRGYSGAYRRGPAMQDGLHVANVHVMLPHPSGSDWSFDEGYLLWRIGAQLRNVRNRPADTWEPVGLNTHHKVMTPECFDFLRRLFAFSRQHGIEWLGAKELFPE